ncbi:hypothetical protein BC827DRAFT_1163410 [Russula dissimulans]|nr:hypothetical protein BC827DRAFT_1163410 [Russula dissimulans]
MTVWYVIVILCISITCCVSAVCIQSRRVPSYFGRSILVRFGSLLTVMVFMKIGEITDNIYVGVRLRSQ